MSEKVKINIAGMTCVNCSNAIERVTRKMKGVKGVNVSFNAGLGEFEVENQEVIPQIKSKIQKLGYEIAEDYAELEIKKQNHLHNLKVKFSIALVLSAVIMACEMWFDFPYSGLVAWLGASVVVFWCGRIFITHGIASLKNRNYDMNVLVMLGSGVAYLYSSVAYFVPNTGGHFYFSSSAMIITFILLGKILEENSKIKANSYIKSLLDLSPKTALKIDEKGEFVEILADELKIGDKVLVKTATQIPRDGIITEGKAEIDMSILTGESLPILRGEGEKVYGGATISNGAITLKITANPHETMLNRMMALLSEAGSKKMRVAKTADKIANIFVPSVVGISLFSFVIWLIFGSLHQAISAAVSVLIISCPCALGLATPIAIVCALSNAAKNGVLIKNPDILETMKFSHKVFFDKTGTLSNGEINVVSSDLSDEIIAEVASIEMMSEHLISKAIVRFAKDKGLDFDKFSGEFENIVGFGVRGDDLIIGKMGLLERYGIKIKSQSTGLTQIYVSRNSEYLGKFVLSDTLRTNAKQAIQMLKNMAIAPVMLTGDNAKIAQNVADELGISEIHADILPSEKKEILEASQGENSVIFVGDGVNDALSLKSADAGISMNSGTDLAKDSGDAVLINNDLRGIAGLVGLSRDTMRVIKQNLFWAFFYNAICIPIAAGALYPSLGIMLNPMYGAAAMSLSSTSVVLSSLRLKFRKFY